MAENKTPAQKMAEQLSKYVAAYKPKRRPIMWRCMLKEVREDNLLSRDDVARGTGVSRQKIAGMERGCDCDLSHARRVAVFFGCTVDDIWPELLV